MQTVFSDIGELRTIDDAAGRDNRGALVAPRSSRGELGVAMMSDRLRVENIEACSSSSHVDPLAIIGHRQGVELIVLPVLKIPRIAGAVPDAAEIRKASIGK